MDIKTEVNPSFPDKEPRALSKLRHLITSMDKAEKNAFKRYIRNYSADNHDSRFTQMFDCVNECLAEMERSRKKTNVQPDLKASKLIFYKKFIKRFSQRKFAKVNEVNEIINYLYEKILESLRNQQLTTYVRRELYARMLDIQMLYRKGLYDDCLTMVHHAQKLATKLEAFPQSLELIQIERQILLAQRHPGLAEKIHALYKIEQKHLEDLKATAEFGDLRAEAYLAIQNKTDLDKDEHLRGKMNKLLDHQAKQRRNDTFDLKFFYASIMSFMILNDLSQPSKYIGNLNHKGLEDVIRYFKSIVDLFDTYPDRKKEEPMRYRHNLINYFSYTFSSDEPFNIKLSAYDEEWNKISTSDPDYIHTVVYLKLLESIKEKDFLKGRMLLEKNKVIDLVEELKPQIPLARLHVVCQLSAFIYFIREEFAVADKWFLLSLDAETKESDPELMLACKIYHLLSRFEMGYSNAAAVSSVLLQPISNSLHAMKGVLNFGPSMLNALEALLRVEKTAENIKKVAAEHLPKLREYFPDKKSNSKFNVFIGWLESKESGKTLRAAMHSYL